MEILKIIELDGRSTESSDDAVQQALGGAGDPLEGVKGVDVISTGLRGPKLEEWHVRIRVALVESEQGRVRSPRPRFDPFERSR